MNNMTYKEITEEDFEELFTPITNSFNSNGCWNGCSFETNGEELDYVRQQPQEHIWTIITDDYGAMCLVSGYHFVNRLNYLITEEPVPAGVHYHISLEA